MYSFLKIMISFIEIYFYNFITYNTILEILYAIDDIKSDDNTIKKLISKIKFLIHHLLIHPFLDLTLIAISYRILKFIFKILGLI
jgi:hypothetical protein